MSEVRFMVIGKPQPAGSKTAFVNPKTGRAIITDANKNAKPWKQEIATVARGAMQGQGMFMGPLAMSVVFVLPRPKSHYRTGVNARLLKDAAPEWPATKPDTLKLTRGLEDAMSGVVYRDDAQIVQQFAEKRYCHAWESAHTEVVVSTRPGTYIDMEAVA